MAIFSPFLNLIFILITIPYVDTASCLEIDFHPEDCGSGEICVPPFQFDYDIGPWTHYKCPGYFFLPGYRNHFILQVKNNSLADWELTDDDTIRCDPKELCYRKDDAIYSKKCFNDQMKPIVRCVRKKACALNLSNIGATCPFCTQLRMKDDETFYCRPGYNLESIVYGRNHWMSVVGSSVTERSLVCNGHSVELFEKKDRQMDTHHQLELDEIRCFEQSKCNISNYFNSTDCESSAICEMPLTDGHSIRCDSDYQFQAKFIDPNSSSEYWKDAYYCTCRGTEYQSFSENGSLEARPIGTRCLRQKLVYDPRDCKADEECITPVYQKEHIQCPSFYKMQISSVFGTWESIYVAYIDRADFNVKLFSSYERKTIRTSLKFRCVRQRCKTCRNPCPSCPESDQKIKWDECITFSCGENTVARFGSSMLTNPTLTCVGKVNDSVSLWRSDTGVESEINQDFMCENMCTLQSPIKSVRVSAQNFYQLMSINDYNVMRCTDKMVYYKSDSQDEIMGNDLYCDRKNGKWMFTQLDKSPIIVETGSNLICIYECDDSKFFPECSPYKWDEDCINITRDDNKFKCAENATLWTQMEWKWVEYKDAKFFTCNGGGKVLANGQPLPEGTQIRCRIPRVPEADEHSSSDENLPGINGVIILIIFLAIVIVGAVSAIFFGIFNCDLMRKKNTDEKTEVEEDDRSNASETQSRRS